MSEFNDAAVKKMLEVMDVADNGSCGFSSQGQSMSGFEELATYRNILSKVSKYQHNPMKREPTKAFLAFQKNPPKEVSND